MRAPKLSGKKIEQLAELFSSRIPERELSMANLRGYLSGLMSYYKSRLFRAVDDIERWVKETQESDRRALARVAAARDDRTRTGVFLDHQYQWINCTPFQLT